jgi:mono/diheme cytochrome c family protein
MRGGRVAGVICLALIAVTACGDDGDSTADSGTADGAALYAANCASCHGEDLRGTEKGPSHLSIVYEPNHHPDEAFRRAVVQGVRAHHWEFGDMAPIPGLTASQVDAIIGYVRSVQEREGFEPYPPR